MELQDFEKRVAAYNGYFTKYYPTCDTNYWSEVRKIPNWRCIDQEKNKFFWKDEYMNPSFALQSEIYYIAIFKHPTYGKAVYGASTNRGYRWKFDDMSSIRKSLSLHFGGIESVDDAIKSGYIEIVKMNVNYELYN